MAVFMYSFIAYIPEHRCRIPECDLDDGYSDGGGGFNFLNFTHPSGSENETSCYHYKYGYSNTNKVEKRASRFKIILLLD